MARRSAVNSGSPVSFRDLVIPPLQWPSVLPLSFEILFICLMNGVIFLYKANVLKQLQYSMIYSVVDMLLSVRPCDTSNSAARIYQEIVSRY